MTQDYRTREGDTIDLIAWNYYGTRGGRVVERLMDANPGLADYSERLPGGVLVMMPDLPQPAIGTKAVKLWD